MYTMLIVLSIGLGWSLFMMGPWGGIIGFGIIAATLFRILLLLNDIKKRLPQVSEKSRNENHDEVLGLRDYIKNKKSEEKKAK